MPLKRSMLSFAQAAVVESADAQVRFQWSMVSAVAACIAVIVALWYYTQNLKLTRLSNSARMVLDLGGTFDSTDMRRHRRALATELLASELPNGHKLDLLGDVPVLAFFEEIGYMTRREVLDVGMVWNSFSWWLEPYYLACKDAIQEARNETQSNRYFSEVEWLYQRLCEVAKQEEGKKVYIARSAKQRKQLLERERDLPLTTP